MAGQAGVWMLLVLLPCLCTSTVRAVAPPFQDPELGILPAQFQRQCSCSQALSQGRAALARQSEVLKRLSGLSLSFQKVSPTLQSIERRMEHVLESQGTVQQDLRRFQARFQDSITAFQDTRSSLRRVTSIESELRGIQQSLKALLASLATSGQVSKALGQQRRLSLGQGVFGGKDVFIH